MTAPLPILISQEFDRYNRITLLDNIAQLPIPYREDQDIVIQKNKTEETFPCSNICFKRKLIIS